ncbi:MAG: hypothetical protein LCH52_01670 [Bacteroidetes bacterium]|nr:hypothetical protein [Bacteroidota bacterium]
MKYRLVLLFTVLTSSMAFAQNDDWWEFDDWTFDFGWSHKKPYISLSYGMAENTYFGLPGSIANTGSIEAKLGYSSTTSNPWRAPFEKQSGLFFGKHAYNIGSSTDGSKIQTTAWKFGFDASSGIAYDAGSLKIIPYNSRGMQWSYMTVDTFNITGKARETMDLYNEAIRFGNRFEGGLKFRVNETLELGAGWQRSIVYPRTMFWYWAGSSIIEEIGHGLIDEFVARIHKSSPGATPIVYFLLKNALSYGAYELRQEKMNWPFDTEAPFFSDAYRVTLTWIF